MSKYINAEKGRITLINEIKSVEVKIIPRPSDRMFHVQIQLARRVIYYRCLSILLCNQFIKSNIFGNSKQIYIPIAKKQSIPTIRNIFSIIDGRELASMHLK